MQHLDLSNCCLARVPPVLAHLPRLSSLTLNENEALGQSAAALEPLSALTNLQARERAHVCVPSGGMQGRAPPPSSGGR